MLGLLLYYYKHISNVFRLPLEKTVEICLTSSLADFCADVHGPV